MVKTLPFNAGGCRFNPWPGRYDPTCQNIRQKQYCNKFDKDFKNRGQKSPIRKKEKKRKIQPWCPESDLYSSTTLCSSTCLWSQEQTEDSGACRLSNEVTSKLSGKLSTPCDYSFLQMQNRITLSVPGSDNFKKQTAHGRILIILLSIKVSLLSQGPEQFLARNEQTAFANAT